MKKTGREEEEEEEEGESVFSHSLITLQHHTITGQHSFFVRLDHLVFSNSAFGVAVISDDESNNSNNSNYNNNSKNNNNNDNSDTEINPVNKPDTRFLAKRLSM